MPDLRTFLDGASLYSVCGLFGTWINSWIPNRLMSAVTALCDPGCLFSESGDVAGARGCGDGEVSSH
jgi:hypothetical protein